MPGRVPFAPARSSRAGFTLIEMVVITMVLVIMAGFIVPNMVSLTRSRQRYSVEAAIQRAPLEARNEARSSNQPVQMKVEGDSLVLYHLSDDGTQNEYKRIPLGDAITVTSARQGTNAIDVSSWEWTIYPDGSAESGGLEFSEGSNRKALSLSSQGDSQWLSGDLPDSTEERWPAGNLQQRGSS